jgi:hypothetical protein
MCRTAWTKGREHSAANGGIFDSLKNKGAFINDAKIILQLWNIFLMFSQSGCGKSCKGVSKFVEKRLWDKNTNPYSVNVSIFTYKSTENHKNSLWVSDSKITQNTPL